MTDPQISRILQVIFLELGSNITVECMVLMTLRCWWALKLLIINIQAIENNVTYPSKNTFFMSYLQNYDCSTEYNIICH